MWRAVSFWNHWLSENKSVWASGSCITQSYSTLMYLGSAHLSHLPNETEQIAQDLLAAPSVIPPVTLPQGHFIRWVRSTSFILLIFKILMSSDVLFFSFLLSLQLFQSLLLQLLLVKSLLVFFLHPLNSFYISNSTLKLHGQCFWAERFGQQGRWLHYP